MIREKYTVELMPVKHRKGLVFLAAKTLKCITNPFTIAYPI